jgi:hypothetical protein
MKIFITHASEDKKVAESITFSLRSRGYTVFLDRDDLPPGESFDQQIRNAVQDSDIFVFLISPDSVADGRYTLTELTFARRKWPNPSNHVLPVMVRKTLPDQIPPYLKAVTILEPLGNITAETSAAIDNMQLGSFSRGLSWLFLRSVLVKYRKVSALAMLSVVGVPLAILIAHPKGGQVDPPPLLPRLNPAPVPCSEERNLRSLGTMTPTTIVFTNKETSELRIYWLDHAGNRKIYGTLAINQTLSFQAFMTHPWLIADTNDQCKAIYLPESAPLNITL